LASCICTFSSFFTFFKVPPRRRSEHAAALSQAHVCDHVTGAALSTAAAAAVAANATLKSGCYMCGRTSTTAAAATMTAVLVAIGVIVGIV
jgi:hypothetical protein